MDAIYELTKIDRWFLEKLRHISDIKRFLSKKTLLQLSRQDLLYAKKFGGFREPTRKRPVAASGGHLFCVSVVRVV